MEKDATIDPSTVSGQLRVAVRDSGRGLLELSEASGVDAGVISRLLTDEPTATLDAVDKLAAALGLRLSPASEEAGLPPDLGSLSLTAEQQAARKKDDDAYLAWLDSFQGWLTRNDRKRDEHWAKRKEILIEWQQRGRDLQEMYLERLRQLAGGDGGLSGPLD